MLEGYYLRRPTRDDVQAVLGLMVDCDRRDVGFPDSDENELIGYWDRIDLSADAWLAYDQDHILRGYAAVMPWTNGKLVAVYDAPGSEETDLFLALTILGEGRARALLRDEDTGQRFMIAQYISEQAEYQKKILAHAGYRISRFLFNMHRDLRDVMPARDWPNHYHIRIVKPVIDGRILHALIQDAFEKPGRKRRSFESWRSWMMHPSSFIADIWFVLEHKGEMVGCALCFEYEHLGWVRQLAVRADHRGRGLGRVLLQHAFSVFKNRGFSTVGLAVEAENLKALNLYQSVGMKKVVHLNEFSKRIT